MRTSRCAASAHRRAGPGRAALRCLAAPPLRLLGLRCRRCCRAVAAAPGAATAVAAAPPGACGPRRAVLWTCAQELFSYCGTLQRYGVQYDRRCAASRLPLPAPCGPLWAYFGSDPAGAGVGGLPVWGWPPERISSLAGCCPIARLRPRGRGWGSGGTATWLSCSQCVQGGPMGWGGGGPAHARLRLPRVGSACQPSR